MQQLKARLKVFEKELSRTARPEGTFKRNESGRINSRVYWPGNNPIAESLVGARRVED